MDFALAGKDLIWLLTLIATAYGLWSKFRKDASEVAVWRREQELKVERLEERLTAHKSEHESDAAEAREFRSKVYEFMREQSTRLTKIETLLDLRRNKQEAE